MTHTPGDWKMLGMGYVGTDTKRIANMSDGTSFEAQWTNQEQCSNAHLIAAAPQMLEALEELVAEADDHPGWEGHPHKDSFGFQLARAAILKAKVK